jgi:LysM repeat protein
MVEISHRKAQSFLQSAVDDLLSAEDQTLLDAHLAQCAACRAYAKKVLELEDNLRKVTHTNWDKQQPKLNYQAIATSPATKPIWKDVLNLSQGLGKYTVIAALIAGYFLIVSLNINQGSTPNSETAAILPTPNGSEFDTDKSPTPSAQFTLTDFQTQACESVIHVVEPSDTLAGIALQYGVAIDVIMEYNDLVNSQIAAGMNLNIPLCESTPSRTASTPNNTMTVTPLGDLLYPTNPE